MLVPFRAPYLVPWRPQVSPTQRWLQRCLLCLFWEQLPTPGALCWGSRACCCSFGVHSPSVLPRLCFKQQSGLVGQVVRVAAPRRMGISMLCPSSVAGPYCQEPPVLVSVIRALAFASSLPCTRLWKHVPGFGTVCFGCHRTVVLAFCKGLITDGVILLDDFHAETLACMCMERRKGHSGVPGCGIYSFMITFASPGPCGSELIYKTRCSELFTSSCL